jgi:glycosyltransferase involved in cell wall biosynthesis
MDAAPARNDISAERPNAAAGILYISYDGMLEPLGQSQVLAYLERLAPGRRIHLISFEKAQDWKEQARRAAVGRRIAAAGISWHPLRYHKSPSAPATAFDIAAGSALALALAVRHHLGIIHARSYVPGLMALAARRATGASFLFDMRGFWADERVDGNLWRADGRLYRAAKRAERKLLLAADHVVTLTHASEAELRRWPYLQERMPPITVIPTCADLDRFTIRKPPQRDPFVLGYVGSVGTWYLLDEMLHCFVLLKRQRPDARLLIVNRSEHALIKERLDAAGIDRASVELIAADHSEMPAQLARMSAAMALIKPAYSKIASAATKLAEYLGCGVPCLGNRGVGDMAEILEQHRVGVAVPGFGGEDLEQGMRRLIALACEESIQERCRSTAVELFSLKAGTEAYGAIYDSLRR